MEKMKKKNAEKKKKKKEEEEEEEEEYSYCKICRINHKQGRRHNYFPRHTNSLSSLFSRFLHKLSLLNSSLTNPTFFLPQHSSSLWCIFCDVDVHDLPSSFQRGNVIKHLASEDHLKNVKHFLWKYGGGSNKVDSFRVTEAEFTKWEKKCEALKCKATSPSGIHHGSSSGELNDIQPNYGILNNFDKNNIHFREPTLSNNVLPLQYNTNENYQVSCSDISEASKVGPSYLNPGLHMPQGSEHGLNTSSSTYIDYGSGHVPSPANFLSSGPAHKVVHINQSMANGDPSYNGYQSLTRITSAKLGDDKGNVYSGAPPPWLEVTDPVDVIGQPTAATSKSAQKNSRKTSKLNPNRVGAAWAEKRRKEMEMEKRGEIVAAKSTPDWLPNFGSVWQSGSRKESMKYFKKETVSAPKIDCQLEADIELKPYISKRMRVGTQPFPSGSFQDAGHPDQNTFSDRG